MFELFLARDLPADLTGQVHLHCVARGKTLPAWLMTSILLAFSMSVAQRIAPTAIATPPGNTALLCPAS
ncbi:hypothetical protein EOS_07010 [Caballeronia mineralivorans PML1(12)]|uniref:Uncharacterized protein n=1 Tax=Caballeronia mineralivorans PML1(12) TaxID=908627 RepID=A0A0J1G3V8_9BURK|nr:hypothetical protein [Caballeronia mineralivorans]KLU26873.1 hypothetical protein EOS_07010 [Caballeronia mineralivorans PML1(12)]